ncbi:ABC transporter permease, partial [Histophilus somni]|uniref:ABC transporter permease n=1 Tax=Histophilus somni TaxID=731 RepID=UPI0034CE925F
MPGVVFSCFMAVLGYAAEKRGIDYGIYILPASMFQAIMFAAGGSCLAMATDMEDGLMNRLKSMPVSGLVTVGGRLMSDLIRSIAAILAIFVFGALWGVTFSLKEGILAFIYSLILAILLSLIFISRALSSKKPRQAALNIQMIEMQFLFFSTGFIPIETLSEPLKTIIKHQPFSPWIDTLRN